MTVIELEKPAAKTGRSGVRNVVVLSGSPTCPSKTELLADMVARDLEERGLTVRHIRLRELPADCLMSLDYENEVIASAVEAVASADGVVIATPTFKASFSGLTKLFLDILPQFGFADKAILPLATGGTLAHVLALDYGLRPVVQSMGARWVVPSFFVTSDAFVTGDDGTSLAPKFRDGLDGVVRAFVDAVKIPATQAA